MRPVVDWVDMVVVAVAILGLPVGILGFVLYHRYVAFALDGLYEGLGVRKVPMKGDVQITFTTFHGVLVYWISMRREVWLPPDDARILLNRLLFFNLTWGIQCLAWFIIHPLSLTNYWRQLSSISRQEETGGAQPVDAEVMVEPTGPMPTHANPSNPYNAPFVVEPGYSPIDKVSVFSRILGGVLIFISLLGFIGITVSFFNNKQFDWQNMAGVAAMLAFLFGTGAYLCIWGLSR